MPNKREIDMVEKIQLEIEQMKVKRDEVANNLNKEKESPYKPNFGPVHEAKWTDALEYVNMEDVGDGVERTLKRDSMALNPISVREINQNDSA